MQHDDSLLKKELNGQATKPAADARWRPTRGGFTVYRRLLQRWGRLASLVTFCVLVLWVVGEHVGGGRVGAGAKHRGGGRGKGVKKLGFDDVFVVQEDGSKEALKGFEAAANASGLEYTVLEALDEGNDTKREMKRSIGASELERQSHIKAWERIRSNDLPSTFVLSASADWDLRLPTSMSSLPQAVSTLLRLSPPSRGPRHHPRYFPFLSSSNNRYGSGWDILFLGHCGASPLRERDYYMFNDTSAPSPSHVFAFPWSPNEQYPRQEGERMVFTPEHLACAGTGYALSYNAAVHLLAAQKEEVKAGVELQDSSLNHLLLNGCRDENIGLKCLAPFPQLFSPAFGHARPGPGIEVSARRNGFRGITPTNNGGGGPDDTTAWVKETGDYGAMPGTREEEVELPDPRAEKPKQPMKKKEVGSPLHGEDDRDGQRGEHAWSSGNCSPGSRGCWDWPRTNEGQKRKFQGEEELRVIRESELGYGGLG